MNLLSDKISCKKVQNEECIKQNVNIITIIDNYHISFIKDIYDYAIILNNYLNHINTKSLFLITTQPYKITEINKSNLFSSFRNIITVKNKKELHEEYYHNVIQLCYDNLSNDYFNEIILFTKFENIIPIKMHSEMNKLVDLPNTSLTLISNIKNILNKKIRAIPINTELYKTTIKSGLLFQEKTNNALSLLKIDNGELYGLNSSQILVNLTTYNCFLINNDVNQNSSVYGMISFTTEDSRDILNAIMFIVHCIQNSDQLDRKLYISLKDTLLQYIEQNNDIESKNMAIVIYSKLKNNCGKVINSLIKNENNSMFIDFGKKSENNINHQVIMKNINLLDKLDDPIALEIQNFINENKDNDSSQFVDSCDFYNSTITLSNWFEEMEINNGIGLLIHIGKGTLELTNTYMSITDYIALTMDYFDKNKNVKFGNLINNKIINGLAIGDANALLPIYINKNHWHIVKKYLEMVLSIISTGHPFNCHQKQIRIYFELFGEMTIQIFDKTKLNDKTVRNYMAYLRTCAEICFEKGYNRGIGKLIKSYLNNDVKTIDYLKICTQALTTGYYLDQETIKQLIRLMITDIIKTSDICGNSTYDEIKGDDYIVNKLNMTLQYQLKFLMSYYNMNFILQSTIGLFGSYNKFIKEIDSNYGLLHQDIYNKMVSLINNVNIPPYVQFNDLYVILNN